MKGLIHVQHSETSSGSWPDTAIVTHFSKFSRLFDDGSGSATAVMRGAYCALKRLLNSSPYWIAGALGPGGQRTVTGGPPSARGGAVSRSSGLHAASAAPLSASAPPAAIMRTSCRRFIPTLLCRP